MTNLYQYPSSDPSRQVPCLPSCLHICSFKVSSENPCALPVILEVFLISHSWLFSLKVHRILTLFQKLLVCPSCVFFFNDKQTCFPFLPWRQHIIICALWHVTFFTYYLEFISVYRNLPHSFFFFFFKFETVFQPVFYASIFRSFLVFYIRMIL